MLNMLIDGIVIVYGWGLSHMISSLLSASNLVSCPDVMRSAQEFLVLRANALRLDKRLIEGLRSKKGVKTTFVYFEKTAIKDLRFSLRIFFFKYTNEYISLEAWGLCANVSSVCHPA